MTGLDLRLVVMGVAGCGKSTLGAALAARTGAAFVDADSLHSDANRAKMAAGIALEDADRWPWLDLVAAALRDRAPVVAACSALRRRYRDRLRQGAGGPVLFVHLSGPRATLAARLAARKGHFFSADLLDSQLATLEPPDPDEGAVTVPLDLAPADQLARALASLT